LPIWRYRRSSYMRRRHSSSSSVSSDSEGKAMREKMFGAQRDTSSLSAGFPSAGTAGFSGRLPSQAECPQSSANLNRLFPISSSNPFDANWAAISNENVKRFNAARKPHRSRKWIAMTLEDEIQIRVKNEEKLEKRLAVIEERLGILSTQESERDEEAKDPVVAQTVTSPSLGYHAQRIRDLTDQLDQEKKRGDEIEKERDDWREKYEILKNSK
ncbi:hypothetical protein PENTCL1PPCAC_21929, partial [Pristionchus entomophagus]